MIKEDLQSPVEGAKHEVPFSSLEEMYLKSHSEDVAVSDFDWSTGVTPRRSARISEKAKQLHHRKSLHGNE
ncbi:Methyl-CpG-binding domain-containing protein 11 [Cucurbita argyrosperma subsp. argyrosperma]|nr:Methyl-CpG-binding domain-containing protein 11 [Cucurbita argyrosperma subsp. argyrosperma]